MTLVDMLTTKVNETAPQITLTDLRKWAIATDQPNMITTHLEITFRKMSQSRFLMENFLNFPLTAQNGIVSYIHYGAEPSVVEVTYRLRERLAVIYPDSERWLTEGTPRIYEILIQNLDLSDRFIQAKERFKFMYQDHKQKMYGWHWFIEPTTLYLTAIYGEKRVLEVIDAWFDNRPSDEIHLFVTAVERWHEFVDMPFDWMWKIISDK